MVLATADPHPWSAPVYFVHVQRRFYFFSSPSSRHVTAALQSGRCAASVFRDSDDWRDIEGLQMDGRIERIRISPEGLRVFRRYVKKFPTVQDFFVEVAFELTHFLERFRTQLYAFVPEQVFYVNNKAGLSKRQEVDLPSSSD
jgi:uncharacterized protein YhbP (UPF0306 family)